MSADPLTIALLPRETLNANQRMHWAAKARLTASIRARATIAYRQAGSPQMGRAHCTVHVGYPDRRTRDIHNWMPTVKASLDGFIHPARGVRGLLPDDCDDYLAGPDLRPAPVTPGRFTFTFRFEELP